MDSLAQGLTSGLAAAAAAFAVSYLLRSTKPVARKEGGVMIVEYGRTMKIFVVIGWLFSVVAAVLAVLASPSERSIAFSVTAIFFLIVLYLHLEFFHVYIRYDDRGLHLSSPWRSNRFVPWSAITEARFSAACQWYVLATRGYGHIRLHLYLSGLQSLLEELSSRGVSIPTTPPKSD